ncbi:MAG: carbamoyltransferase HypF [Bacillota bacterium]
MRSGSLPGSAEARVAIRIVGTVQGVGFRPFICSQAHKVGLSGFVRNDGGDVYIEVAGTSQSIKEFSDNIVLLAPPLAEIRHVDITPLPVNLEPLNGFRVVESQKVPGSEPGISPDVATCHKCRQELTDSNDRRYMYPFINCTDCGPRFTVLEDIPYDRAVTSMKSFTMCPDCQKEYTNPADRRFHAEPNACWECGPTPVTVLEDSSSEAIVQFGLSGRHEWLIVAQQALLLGKTLAIKGVGGFHLACDATSSQAVQALRNRKRRSSRPFAIMVRDLALAQEWFHMDSQEADLLSSRQAPIVILQKKARCPVAENVAPGLDHLGVMLPYSPLHLLLFHDFGVSKPLLALVMTSGNLSGMPLCYTDREARESLMKVADGLVLHNRQIIRPCDDSVVRVVDGAPLFYRRSRGYVPADMAVPLTSKVPVFAAGATGKNVFGLLSGNRVRMSQHIGDLWNESMIERYLFAVRDFTKLCRFRPEVIALDAHPGCLAAQAVREVFPDAKVVTVQHHHAHMTSVMAEHGMHHECVGLILDGTGYGTDGRIWGGEILYGDYSKFQRWAHLAYVSMPGGEKAVLEPWRMAASYLKSTMGSQGIEVAKTLLARVFHKVSLLWPALDWEGYPLTSSTGRLFDAVAALCGISLVNTYDGESASLLGEMALREHRKRGGMDPSLASIVDGWERGGEPLSEDCVQINPSLFIGPVVRSMLSGADVTETAYDFHTRLAAILTWHVAEACRRLDVNTVVLSGGVFQNPLFLRLTAKYMKEIGLRPFWSKFVPPNDGGLCLGQSLVGASMVL